MGTSVVIWTLCPDCCPDAAWGWGNAGVPGAPGLRIIDGEDMSGSPKILATPAQSSS